MRWHLPLSLLIGFVLLSSFASADLQTGLVEYWSFDDADTVGTNSTGKLGYRNGTIHDAITGIACMNNECYNFTDRNDHVNIGSNWETLTSGSISFWIYLFSNTTGIANFVFGQSGEPVDTLESSMGNEKLSFRLTDDFGSLSTTQKVKIREWQNFVLTWNTSGTNIYTNGVLNNSNAVADAPSVSELWIGDSARVSNSGTNGSIDEVGIWNRTLNANEVAELYNSGSGSFFPFAAAEPGSPETPVIADPSPIDNSHNNTNVTLRVNHSSTLNDVRYYLYVGTSTPTSESDLYVNNATRTGDEFKTFLTNLSDGTFFWKWRVQNITNGLFSANTTQRTLVIDTVSPVITLNPTNAFTTSNISTHNQYANFMFMNISFVDTSALFVISVNVTRNGVTFFNLTNTSLNNEINHNFTRNVSTLTWPDGVYDIQIQASDTHTVKAIEDYDISKFISRITFDTQEGNRVDVIGSGAISTTYNKKEDRYEFGFNYLLSSTSRKFTVKCDNDLYYLPNSEFNAHFICWNSGTKNGNWIDFEGIGDDYTVKKIKDKEYEVSFINLPNSNKIEVKSIGGLNIVTENYQWLKGSVATTFTTPGSSGSSQTYILNVSYDKDLVKNITLINFVYNSTQFTPTREDQDTNVIFSSTLTVPSQEVTLNFSWKVNVTQRDDSIYNFTVNRTQSLIQPQINVSIFDEENLSLISESMTIFLSGPTSRQVTGSESVLFSNISLGEHFIQAESNSGSYPIRGIFFNVTNATANVNMYLVVDKSGNAFINYFLQNQDLDRIENGRFTFQKNINNTFVTVAQFETDFAGQGRLFQDQQNRYRIIIDRTSFPIKVIDLFPLLTSYTITLDRAQEPFFENVYEGLVYTITPKDRIINVTDLNTSITLNIFDGSSSLEWFGIELVNHSYVCTPANCIGNVTGSPAGGSVTVQIAINETGTLGAHFFIKRNGFPLQFLNRRNWIARVFEALVGESVFQSFLNFGNNLGTPNMRAVIAGVLNTVLIILAAQFGVIGLGLLFVACLGTMFFMAVGFIDLFIGMIILIFGLAIYFVISRFE